MKTTARLWSALAMLVVMSAAATIACSHHGSAAGPEEASAQDVVYLFTDRTCPEGPIQTRIRFESQDAKEVYLSRRAFQFQRGGYTLEPEQDPSRAADQVYFIDPDGEPRSRWQEAR